MLIKGALLVGAVLLGALAIFAGYYFFGHEPDPLESSDLQARREFERSAQRNRAEEAAKDAQANKPEAKDDAR
jgi:hypothetical protein